MPAWFDLSQLHNLTDSTYDDEQGLLRSVAAVDGLIQAEIDAGIPANKIVVGGFSQGGAIACLTALVSERRLAGVACLSTWLVLGHKAEQVGRPPYRLDVLRADTADGQGPLQGPAYLLGSWPGRPRRPVRV